MNKILLVEDEKILREAFTILLGSQGYDVHVACNGQEAYEKCQTNAYDLILLDLMMPVLDGVGFLKKAQLPKTAPSTKVILLSNLSSGDQVTEALSLGVYRQEIKSNLGPGQIVSILKEELS